MKIQVNMNYILKSSFFAQIVLPLTLLFFFFFFWLYPQGLKDLSSLARDQTWTQAVEAWSPKHWTTGEFP